MDNLGVIRRSQFFLCSLGLIAGLFCMYCMLYNSPTQTCLYNHSGKKEPALLGPYNLKENSIVGFKSDLAQGVEKPVEAIKIHVCDTNRRDILEMRIPYSKEAADHFGQVRLRNPGEYYFNVVPEKIFIENKTSSDSPISPYLPIGGNPKNEVNRCVVAVVTMNGSRIPYIYSSIAFGIVMATLFSASFFMQSFSGFARFRLVILAVFVLSCSLFLLAARQLGLSGYGLPSVSLSGDYSPGAWGYCDPMVEAQNRSESYYHPSHRSSSRYHGFHSGGFHGGK